MKNIEYNATLGTRLHGGDLIEQAIATRTIIQADLERLKAEKLFSDQDLATLDALIQETRTALAARKEVKDNAQRKTNIRSTTMRDLRLARRRLDMVVARVFENSPELSNYWQDNYLGANPARFGVDLAGKLSFAQGHLAELSSKGIDQAFLDGLKKSLESLQSHSGEQEAASASLPDSARNFAETKARLFRAIKDANYAGRALHATDRTAAGKYTLMVLNRRSQTRPTPATGVPALVPQATPSVIPLAQAS